MEKKITENFGGREILVEEQLAAFQDDNELQTRGSKGRGSGVAADPMYRNIIRWLIYATAFLTPLWFLPLTADTLEFNKQIFLIVIASISLVLYLVEMIKSGIIRFRPSSFYFPILGLVAAGVVSVVFAVNKWNSLFGIGESRAWSLISIVSLAVIFFLAVNVIEDKGRALKKIMRVSLVLAFLFGILQIFGIFLFEGAKFATRGFNSVGTLNSLGILAALSLAFFGSGSKEKKDDVLILKYLDFFRYPGLVFALFIVVLINWWPIWTVAFASLLASVALASAGDVTLFKKGKMQLFAMPMAVIILGIFLMLINFNWAPIKSKLSIEVAPSQRVSWKIAFDSMRSRPLGHGGENFIIAYDKYKPASIANSIFYQIRFSDATSEAASLVVEGGALMILAFLYLFWVYGNSLLTLIKKGFDNKGISSTWAASLGLLVAFFLYPFNITFFLLLFLFLTLLAVSSERAQEERVINLESDAKYSFAGSIMFIVGLVSILVAGYFTVNNYLANIYLAKASVATDRDKAIEYFVESANSNDRDPRVYRLLSQTILSQLADGLRTGPKKEESRDSYNARIQNQVASAVNVALRATNVDPTNSQNWMNRGAVYQNLLTLVGGADQAAVNTFNESLARNPADPVAYLRIGNVYLAIADNLQRAISSGQIVGSIASARQQMNEGLASAEENFKKAISIYNNYGQALYNLAVVYDRQGKLADAIKQFEKLQTTNQRDPSVAFQLGLLYYRNNQKDNAFRAWQQAVFIFPNYSNARWYLSLIYEERGDLAKALEQVQEIQRLNPNNELIEQRLTQLGAGLRTIPPERLLDKKPLGQ